MTDTLRDLIERVERSEKADPAINDDIARHLGWTQHSDEADPVYTRRPQLWWAEPGEEWSTMSWPPNYTGSVDAAMLLRPEGWTIAQIGEGDDGSWFCELREGHRTSYQRVAMSPIKSPTPALALVAACLRAHMGTGG